MKRLALLVALVAVAALVIATSASGPRSAQLDRRSRLPGVANPGRAGLAAAAAWLAATGRASSVTTRAGAPPAPGQVWLLAAPAAPVPAADAAAFLSHAAAGGLSVWALGAERQPQLEALLQARRVAGRGERTVAGLPDGGPLAGLVLRAPGDGVVSTRPGARPATGPDDPPAALLWPVGRGEVLLLAGTELLDNARIVEADHLSLWVRLAARGPIVFDERWLRPEAVPTPLRLPLLVGGQALLAALLLVIALGWRHGAIRPPPAAGARLTARDYLATLAALSRRAGAEPELAAAAWRRLRRTLEREAGIPARLSGQAAAARLSARAPEGAAALQRGEVALRHPAQGQLLAVTRAAADVEGALGSFDTVRPGR
jgi:hypothetical protein